MSTPAASHGHPLRIIAIDNMRNRSHLFWRWFSTLPGIMPRLHPCVMAAMFGPEGWMLDLHVNQKRADHLAEVAKVAPKVSFDDCLKTVEGWIEDAEKTNQCLFFNEHAMFLMKTEELLDMSRNGAYSAPKHNPSYLPDSLLSTFTPIFVIRHPALSVPSLWRHVSTETPLSPLDEDFDVFTSLHFARALFDFLKTTTEKTLIVIDGEDVVWRTEELGNKLCLTLGFDTARPSEVWEPTSQDMRPQEWWIWSLVKDMHESRGIVKPDVERQEPALENELVYWKEEFGDEIAMGLRKVALQNMPHYEYLKQFAL